MANPYCGILEDEMVDYDGEEIGRLRDALVAAETTLVRMIRADLIDKDFSGMQITDLVDTNPTIVKIRKALG